MTGRIPQGFIDARIDRMTEVNGGVSRLVSRPRKKPTET